MGKPRKINIVQAEYAIVYYQIGVEEERTAFFAQDRYDIVMENLEAGILNVSEAGGESVNLILTSCKVFKAESSCMDFTHEVKKEQSCQSTQ